MPLLELTFAGKALASSGLIKLAGVNSSAAAAAALAPAHPGPEELSLASTPFTSSSSLWTSFQALCDHASALSDHASALVGTAATFAGTASQPLQAAAVKLQGTGVGAVTVAYAAGAVYMLQTTGFFDSIVKCFGSEQSQDDGDEDKPARMGVMLQTLLGPSLARDLFMGGVLIFSLGQPLAVPWRGWAVGSLALSFPLTFLIDHLKKSGQCSIREAFLVELLSCAASFAWLAYGTLLLGGHPAAAQNAPLLWWTIFFECVFTWSCMSTAVFCLVFVTVMGTLGSGSKRS